MTRPRVILADDHAMLLEAFRRLLEPQFEVVGMAGDGYAMLDLALKSNPDVVILDVSMPRLNGIDAFRQLRNKLPAVKGIFLTVDEDPDLAAEAIRLGASGFLLKSSASSELTSAIECALQGQVYVTPLITGGRPLKEFLDEAKEPGSEKLTSRQREVLQLLAEGRLMKEVAEILNITPRTVAFHKYAMMEQLGITTSAELVQYAVSRKLVTPSR
jgi:DNA-binding NarL/FixJ family response regulator